MNCEVLSEQGYETFSRRLHKKVAEQRVPVSGSLEVTLRCNVRCQHCYVPLSNRRGPASPELHLDEIKGILDEIAQAGCLWLVITGGEPLMRHDFKDIYLYAKHKGFLLTLFTNGTLLTPKIADFLAEWRPFNIEITLYGYTRETYESVTGIPGSHERCMQGIRLLLERRLPLKLKTVLMTLNRHELADMQSFAEQLGVEFRFDPMVNAGIDGSLEPTSLRLLPEEIVTLERNDPDRARRWPEHYQNLAEKQIQDRQLYLCGAGKTSFHIDSFGRLSLCQSARQPSFDLRHGSFRQGWDEFLAGVRAQEYSEDYACGSCELRPVCSQCPAVSYLEHGDSEKPVEFVCDVAHLRRQIFSRPLPAIPVPVSSI